MPIYPQRPYREEGRPGDALRNKQEDWHLGRTEIARIGLVVVALVAITIGLNLMNVRNNWAVLAGFIAVIGGFVLGGLQLWKFYKGIEK